MTEEGMNRFFDLLIDAMNSIEPAYLYTVYSEMDQVIEYVKSEAHRANLMKHMEGSDLLRTGERIFCYELYHQLRKRIELSPEWFEGLYLQAELRKYQVPEILAMLELKPLSGDFIPDFLLHSPGNSNDHAFAIEVKTDRQLKHTAFAADISKLIEFIEQYGYQRGIFIATRISFDFLCSLIKSCFILERDIPRLWDYVHRITVVHRENENTAARFFKLNELIQPGGFEK